MTLVIVNGQCIFPPFKIPIVRKLDIKLII